MSPAPAAPAEWLHRNDRTIAPFTDCVVMATLHNDERAAVCRLPAGVWPQVQFSGPMA